ncbi:MAG: GNAT family N-acetyltransferase, partial [Elusimicrobiota bacterium]
MRTTGAGGFQIGRAGRGDWPAIRRICARTARGGRRMGAARARAFAERWVGPYERFLSRWTLRALRKGRVAGYLTGCPDTRALIRFAGPDCEPAAAAPAHLRRLVLRRYPAHLHMNVAPAFQGKGLGGRLIGRYLSMLKRSGARGVHLVCGEGPEAFYMRKWFSLLERFRSGGV